MTPPRLRRPRAADAAPARRLRLARGIDRLLAAAEQPLVTGPMARRPVVNASRQALGTVSALLHDAERPLHRSAVAEAERFLTDGARSPLYGHDGAAARAAAETLAERLAAA